MSDVEPKRGRGRPRRADADQTIIAAAAAVLSELRFAAFTVDAVADRTGIAKTTIYRRWPTRGALVSAVVQDAVPLRGESVDDLLDEVVKAMRMLNGSNQPLSGDVIPHVVEVLVPILASRRDRLVALLPPMEAEGLADALCGALLLRFISGDGVDAAYARMLTLLIVRSEV